MTDRRFDSNRAAANFIKALSAEHIYSQFGHETQHLKQKALEDPHSSNCYFAELPLDYTEEGSCLPTRDLANPSRSFGRLCALLSFRPCVSSRTRRATAVALPWSGE